MEVKTQGRADVALLRSTVPLAQELLGNVLVTITAIDVVTDAPEFLRNRRVSDLTADISRFVEITTLLSKLFVTNKPELLSRVKESHVHLLFIVKGIVQYHQKRDLLALEELIKYELKDNLTQWKIDLIPQIKRLL